MRCPMHFTSVLRLMGCTNLQDQEAAILAVSLRSNRSLKVGGVGPKIEAQM